MPHPVGGACWKETRSSASENNIGWREEDFSTSNIVSPVFPEPFPVLFYIQMLQIAETWYLIRQVSDAYGHDKLTN